MNHFGSKYGDLKLITVFIDGYSTAFRRDQNKPCGGGGGGGILVYMREDIPCKLLNLHRFPDNIEGLFFEVNFRKTKILLFATYHPPNQYDR